jgi:hypothetical protein
MWGCLENQQARSTIDLASMDSDGRSRKETPPMETGDFRRRYERKRYNKDVVFSLKNYTFAGTLKDISMGGAFVLTQSVNQVQKGDVIKINIPFTDGMKTINRRAKVLWTSGEGFAVEFF